MVPRQKPFKMTPKNPTIICDFAIFCPLQIDPLIYFVLKSLILFLLSPFQSTDYLGRKIGMMVVNVPFAIAWFLMYQASDVSHLFIANSLLGLSVGLMEAPIMTYLGEISEPATRGILISYTNLGTPLGGFVVFFLNTLTTWRTVGLICLCVPILTVVALTFVPETPHWLIGKGRIERAERALCWLRYASYPYKNISTLMNSTQS